MQAVLADTEGEVSLDAVPAPELLAALGHTPSHALLDRLGGTMPITAPGLTDAGAPAPHDRSMNVMRRCPVQIMNVAGSSYEAN